MAATASGIAQALRRRLAVNPSAAGPVSIRRMGHAGPGAEEPCARFEAGPNKMSKNSSLSLI